MKQCLRHIGALWRRVPWPRSTASSRWLELLLFAGAACLPAFTWALLDSGFALFAAPVLLILAVEQGAAVWIVLWLVRCPARARAAILLALSLGFSIYVASDLHHTYTAEGRFERLLMEPIPQSVHFIATYGHIAMAGGEEVVVFALEPHDLERIVQARGFEEQQRDAWGEDSSVSRLLPDAQGHGIEPGHVYVKGEIGDRLLLITNPEKTRAYLCRESM